MASLDTVKELCKDAKYDDAHQLWESLPAEEPQAEINALGCIIYLNKTHPDIEKASKCFLDIGLSGEDMATNKIFGDGSPAEVIVRCSSIGAVLCYQSQYPDADKCLEDACYNSEKALFWSSFVKIRLLRALLLLSPGRRVVFDFITKNEPANVYDYVCPEGDPAAKEYRNVRQACSLLRETADHEAARKEMEGQGVWKALLSLHGISEELRANESDSDSEVTEAKSMKKQVLGAAGCADCENPADVRRLADTLADEGWETMAEWFRKHAEALENNTPVSLESPEVKTEANVQARAEVNESGSACGDGSSHDSPAPGRRTSATPSETEPNKQQASDPVDEVVNPPAMDVKPEVGAVAEEPTPSVPQPADTNSEGAATNTAAPESEGRVPSESGGSGSARNPSAPSDSPLSAGRPMAAEESSNQQVADRNASAADVGTPTASESASERLPPSEPNAVISKDSNDAPAPSQEFESPQASSQPHENSSTAIAGDTDADIEPTVGETSIVGVTDASANATCEERQESTVPAPEQPPKSTDAQPPATEATTPPQTPCAPDADVDSSSPLIATPACESPPDPKPAEASAPVPAQIQPQAVPAAKPEPISSAPAPAPA
eukprot:Rmarinus@m.1460